MTAKTDHCQHCGRKIKRLMLSRDPWDADKEKWVCVDATACAKARARRG